MILYKLILTYFNKFNKKTYQKKFIQKLKTPISLFHFSLFFYIICLNDGFVIKTIIIKYKKEIPKNLCKKSNFLKQLCKNRGKKF